jgi:hypothetical protein
MIRVLFSVMLLAVIAAACPCLADDQPSELKADAAYGVLHAEERVIDLPADQGKWHISVVGNPRSAKYQTVKGWFDSHPSLKHLKAQTHFHPIATTTAMYRDRYAKSTPKVPCVRIQSADGKVMYQVCGQNIPMSADALDQAIRTELFRRRRCRPSPQPQPQPQPEPQPQPDPTPQPLDHVGPPDVAPEPKSGLPPWWLLVGLAVLGAGAGVVAKWKETYYPSTKK